MTKTVSSTALFDLDNVFAVDDYLYFYGEVLSDDRTEAEVAALVNLLELDVPMRLLDLACGFGRHANRLAALGHQVTGIDLVPGFLDLARQEAVKRGVQVDYQQGDMRAIDFETDFDRVLLLFTAFGYFTDEENLQVLQKAGRALKPGGLLLFDIHNRDVILKGFLPHFVMEKDGDLMIDRSSFDSFTGLLHNQRIVIRDGVRRDKPFSIRLYNANEIQALLPQAGLEVQNIYGTWDGQPVSSESRRMIIIASRPE